MLTTHLTDMFNQAIDSKPISLSYFLKVGFSKDLDSLSQLEASAIREHQLYLATKTNIVLNIMALILITYIWLYTRTYSKNNYVDLWYLVFCMSSTWLFVTGVYILNEFNKTAQGELKKIHKQFVYLSIPGCLFNSLCWGSVVVVLELSFGAGKLYGEPIIVAIMAVSYIWAFPFFQLSVLASSSVYFSFLFSYMLFHPEPAVFILGSFTLYYITVIGISCIMFLFFLNWARKNTIAELQNSMSHLFLDELEKNTTVWLWQTNEAGDVLFVSEKMKDILKVDYKMLMSKKFLTLFDGDHHKTSQLADIIKAERPFINFNIPTSVDGKQITWGLSAQPVFKKGVFNGYRGVGTDITKSHELKQIEQQKTFYDSFTQMSSMLSHDFNNLLAGISLRIDYLNHHLDLSQQEKQFIDESLELCKKTSNITKKMLAYSRQESLNMQSLPLDNLLDLVINEYSQEKVKFHLRGEDGLHVYSDDSLLNNALTNIVSNAVRAINSKGDIYINRKLIPVTDKLFKESHKNLKQSDYVCLSFEDTGSGFSSIDLEQAFVPFYTRNRHTGGSGLGLSMVKGFTQQAGGDTFISNGEYGAKVELFLPAAELKRTLSKNNHLKQQSNFSGLRNIHLLLVEDNDEFGNMLSNLLKSYCAEVIYVQTVVEARKALHANEHINFVVSDFLLPDGEGSEIVRLTRILGRPIQSFYISGYLDKQIEDPLEKAVILRKPFTLNELMSKLEEVHGDSLLDESD